MSPRREWSADACTCGHPRSAYKRLPARYPAVCATRGQCQGARDFAAEMGWKR